MPLNKLNLYKSSELKKLIFILYFLFWQLILNQNIIYLLHLCCENNHFFINTYIFYSFTFFILD